MVKGNSKSNKQDQGALEKLHSTRDPPCPHSKAELQNTVLGAAPKSSTVWNQQPPCPAGAQEAQVKTERVLLPFDSQAQNWNRSVLAAGQASPFGFTDSRLLQVLSGSR